MTALNEDTKRNSDNEIFDVAHGKVWINGHKHPLFQISDGRIDHRDATLLIGPSGSGKSSFGRWLAGYQSKHITIYDEKQNIIQPSDQYKVGYVRQSPYHSFHPYLSLKVQFEDLISSIDQPRLSTLETVYEQLLKLNIFEPQKLLKRRIHEISLGEASRCAVLFSLIQTKDYLVLDEITAHLDHNTADLLMNLIGEFSLKYQMGYLLISHQVDRMANYCQSHLEIKDHKLQPFTHTRSYEEILNVKSKLYSDTITLRGIEYSYVNHSGQPNIRIPELQIPIGQITGIYGPSGIGKTSLVLGLLGERSIKIDELIMEDVSYPRIAMLKEKCKIRYLPQAVRSIFHPRQSFQTSINEIVVSQSMQGHILHTLMVGLQLDQKLLQQRPIEVSGGQVQRFGLLSVLLAQPDLLILDESFSDVDRETRKDIWTFVAEYCRQNKTTILLISHDIDWLLQVSNQSIDLTQFTQLGFTGY